MDVQFFLDYRSPYSYLAATQLDTLGVDIVLEPVNILAVMKTVNNQPSPVCPPKMRYAGVDAARWAKHYGVAYSPNRALLQAMSTGQFDGTLLSRAGVAARQLGVLANVNKALFEAVWASDADLVSEAGRNAFFAARGQSPVSPIHDACSGAVRRGLQSGARTGTFGCHELLSAQHSHRSDGGRRSRRRGGRSARAADRQSG